MTDRLDSGQFFIEERLSIYNSQFGEAVHGIPMDRGREKRGLNRRGSSGSSRLLGFTIKGESTFSIGQWQVKRGYKKG